MSDYSSILGKNETRDLVSRVKKSPLGNSVILRDTLDRRSVEFFPGEVPLSTLLKNPKSFLRASMCWHNDLSFLGDIVSLERKLREVTGDNFDSIGNGKLSIIDCCNLPDVSYKFVTLWSGFFLLHGIQYLGRGVVNSELNDIDNAKSAFYLVLELLKNARIRTPEQVEIMKEQYNSVIDSAEDLVLRRVEFSSTNRMRIYSVGDLHLN